MDLELLIQQKITEALAKLYKLKVAEVHIEHPDNPSFGDYATNIPLVLTKELKKAPMEIAEEVSAEIRNDLEDTIFEAIETAKPGFINFRLSKEQLLKTLHEAAESKEKYGRGNLYDNKKIMVEYTDPNPFKVFHIGHLMTNVIGEAVSRLLSNQGAEVKRANYQGDVGMHVAKSIWGMRKKLDTEGLNLQKLESMPLEDRMIFLGQAYALGATAYKEDESAKSDITKINNQVYGLDEAVSEEYAKGRQWSLDYFETLYSRLGTKFDYYYFEREAGDVGQEVVKELLQKGEFEESDGAIIFRAEKYGLHTRVFVNSQKLPTYEAKDLGLSRTKAKDFPYDLSIIVTANEIDEYFKVVIKALSLISPELAEKTKHLSHGMLKLKSGKMSSRTGKIIAGDELLNKVQDVVLERMEDKDVSLADKIAVAALKYGVLKNGIGNDIIFDEESWLSLTGDTGPYIQYTYARTNSVVAKLEPKAKSKISSATVPPSVNADELAVLRTIYKFPEVAREAAEEFSPNKICTYLNSLARKFNSFYSSNRILDAADEQTKLFRLLLTQSVHVVLENGLWLLGIESPEKM